VIEPVEIRAPKNARLLEIEWSDGQTTAYEHLVLRALCPCAHCQGHQGPISWVAEIESIDPRGLELLSLGEVGSYALSLGFADGHSTGIYTFEYLRALAKAFELPLEAKRELTFDR
jgi:DUF971 family protein